MDFVDLEAQQRRIRADIERRIHAVLDHGRYLQGPEVAELERSLADYAGTGHAIAVSSGTDALVAALMALDIGPGDEVIVPAFSFVATAEAVRLVGARPAFCDIDAQTYTLDPQRLEALIGPATKAVIPVDLFGQCADYEAIDEIAHRHRVPLVADAAQSFGATSRGRRVGAFARLTATSFHPSNPLGAYGDGGAVLTDDDGLAALLRQIRNHGREEDLGCARVGLNARLDSFQCAVLLAKLGIFDDELRRRRAVADIYDRLLRGHVRVPTLRPWNASTWACYTVEVPQRDAAHEALRTAGIPTRVHYARPLHREPPYANDTACPVAERAATRVLSLPMHPYLKPDDQERIAAALVDAIRLQRDAAGLGAPQAGEVNPE